MKLNVFNRKKTALEKLTSTYDVKLDASASQLIMDVLAKLYDNPVEAAIREYVSNAYDANVEAGSTEPVHLHITRALKNGCEFTHNNERKLT